MFYKEPSEHCLQCGRKTLQRCSAALLTAAVFFLPSAACTRKPEAPLRPQNVLLIVIDTLGAEHTGVYSAKVDSTPQINAWAAQSLVFERAYSAAPWTKPSIASLFTALVPSQHKVKGIDLILENKFHTLAEYFKENGFATAGIVSHTLLAPPNGYDQGFDFFKRVEFKGNVHNSITADQVSDRAIDWLNQRPAQKPFFMFLHYFDPHFNYQHHPKFDRTSWYKGPLKPGTELRQLREMIPRLTPDDIRYLVDLHHEEIAFTDEQVGRVLSYLNSRGLSRNTLVVLTADHGEEFMRHGFIGHSRTLYDELTHVPFIFSWPGQIEPGRVSDAVSTKDLLPTLLDLFRVKPTAALSGISLLPYFSADKREPRVRDIFSEVDFKSSYIDAHMISVVRGGYKLILNKANEKFELYDLSKDPEELHDISAADPGRVQELSQKILEYRRRYQVHSRGGARPQKIEKTPEEVEQLKSLGYL